MLSHFSIQLDDLFLFAHTGIKLSLKCMYQINVSNLHKMSPLTTWFNLLYYVIIRGDTHSRILIFESG